MSNIFSRTNCYMGMEELTDLKGTLQNYVEMFYSKKRNATLSGGGKAN